MAFRISCPSCETELTFNDDKRGKKIRCRECDEVITLPAAKSAAGKGDGSFQEGASLKAKSTRPPAEAEDEDEDERPAKKTKKKSKSAKKGLPLGWIIGGAAAAVVVFVLLALGGVAAVVMFRKPAPVVAINNGPKVEVPQPLNAVKQPEPVKPPEPVKKAEPKKKPEPVKQVKPINEAPVNNPPIAPDAWTLPLERKPADLTAKLLELKDRKVSVHSIMNITIPDGKVKQIACNMDVDLLETMNTHPKGFEAKTTLKRITSSLDVDGAKIPMLGQALKILRAEAPVIMIDATNRVFAKKTLKLNPKLSPDLYQDVERMHSQLSSSLQAASVPMPNRVLQPEEKWTSSGPLILGSGPKRVVLDLILNCTYEGIRTRAQRSEAFVSVMGTVQGRSKIKGVRAAPGTDEVTGKMAFDLAGGFISLVQLRISSQGEQDSLVFDIEVARVPDDTMKAAGK